MPLPRNSMKRCALCSSTDVRILEVTREGHGKAAYLGCAWCGLTWITRSVAKALMLPTSSFSDMRKRRSQTPARWDGEQMTIEPPPGSKDSRDQ